jgi:hypothetical protein
LPLVSSDELNAGTRLCGTFTSKGKLLIIYQKRDNRFGGVLLSRDDHDNSVDSIADIEVEKCPEGTPLEVFKGTDHIIHLLYVDDSNSICGFSSCDDASSWKRTFSG